MHPQKDKITIVSRRNSGAEIKNACLRIREILNSNIAKAQGKNSNVLFCLKTKIKHQFNYQHINNIFNEGWRFYLATNSPDVAQFFVP